MARNLQFLAIMACANSAFAHVALTNPPARFPPRDFLDSVRTPSPCGVHRPWYCEFVAQFECILVQPRRRASAEATRFHRSSPSPGTCSIRTRVGFVFNRKVVRPGGFTIRLLDDYGRVVEFLAGQNVTDGAAMWMGLDDFTCVEPRKSRKFERLKSSRQAAIGDGDVTLGGVRQLHAATATTGDRMGTDVHVPLVLGH